MSWWGKVIGGAFGFALGGPLGAALGAALGHNFDRGMGQQARIGSSADQERIQSAFFTATFSMMGYIAKADGRVSETEIAMARDIMGQMHLTPEQRKVAIRLFEEGKQPGFPADEALKQFREVCHRRLNLLQMFMEILILTACADGELHASEEAILRQTAVTLGFPGAVFEALLHQIQAGRRFHSQGHTRPNARPSANARADAYRLLGISESATDQDVKKAYRRLMNQHHPDKLVSKGLPEEMMALAEQKTQEIRSAYELIRSTRKM